MLQGVEMKLVEGFFLDDGAMASSATIRCAFAANTPPAIPP